MKRSEWKIQYAGFENHLGNGSDNSDVLKFGPLAKP